jgi:hypothetical protein
VWPPTLEDLKSDQKIALDDTRDDVRLQRNLTAAISFVQRTKAGAFNFDDESDSELPDPDADLELGTIRLAARWNTRPRSPDGLINSGELGSARITSFDPDIDRMLRIGRYAGPVFA